MNRYTEITPSKFDPLSLQEIMLVPMMKRRQHDALVAQSESMRQGLAKVDPHEKYFNRARELKQGIESKFDSMTSELAKSGINNDMISKGIALNREYQDLVSPTGEIGQINAHKINLKKLYDESIQNSIKMGNSEEIARKHADMAVEAHMAEPLYNDNGRVIDFKSPSAAKYIDPIALTNELAKSSGMSENEWKTATAALTYDMMGNRYVVDSAKAAKSGNNVTQLQAVAKTLNEHLSDPSSDFRKSVDYNFQDPNSVLQRINSQLGIYQRDSKSTLSTTGIGSVAWNDGKNKDGTEGDYISTETQIKSDAYAQDYTGNLERTKDLSKKVAAGTATKDEQDEYTDRKELQRIADAKLNGDPAYKEADKRYKEASRLLEEEGRKMGNKRRPGEEDIDYYTRINLAKGANSKADKYKGMFIQAKNDRQKIKDAAWRDSSSAIHNYNYIPTTKEEAGVYDLHNENIGRVLTNAGSINNLLDVKAITLQDGTWKTGVNQTDTDALSEVLRNADPKSFEITNISSSGHSKKPEITIKFKTNKGSASQDTDGTGRWFKSDDIGGDEQTVSMKVNLKKLSDAPSTGSAGQIKNLSALITDFHNGRGKVVKYGPGAGRTQGTNIANDVITNLYSGDTVENIARQAMSGDDYAGRLLAGRAASMKMSVKDYINKYGKQIFK